MLIWLCPQLLAIKDSKSAYRFSSGPNSRQVSHFLKGCADSFKAMCVYASGLGEDHHTHTHPLLFLFFCILLRTLYGSIFTDTNTKFFKLLSVKVHKFSQTKFSHATSTRFANNQLQKVPPRSPL